MKSNNLYFEIRSKYQKKRQSIKWKKRKANALRIRKVEIQYKNLQILREEQKRYNELNLVNQQKAKPAKPITAPPNFSFIDNTNQVLDYFDKARMLFRRGENVNFNIDDINNLTSDTIALMIASINNPDFIYKGFVHGRAPQKPELRRLFTESGFYRYVISKGYYTSGKGNILHKETNYKVVPQIAKKCALEGIKHTFGNENPFEPLYDILIECMSNTNNHASLDNANKCKWWLYVYNEPNTNITSYSFIDLGVGIYESMKVKGYFEKILKDVKFVKNINYVNDLLEGKIQSRMEEDNEIRGKGIPQIVDYSKLDVFKRFVIITNDVKINIKTGESEELKRNFSGTLIYWEIQSV